MLKKPVLWAGMCILLGLFTQNSCTHKDEAEVIHRLIKKGAKLAEAHNVGGLMELTSEGFSAMPGNRDRAEVRSILFMAFRHYRDFRILYPQPGVDLEESGEAASATIYFLIVRKERSYPELKDLYGDPGGWLEEVGENADLYRLTLDLIKKEGDWLTTQAHLEPFNGYGFGEKP
jgi:hypothetical protein